MTPRPWGRRRTTTSAHTGGGSRLTPIPSASDPRVECTHPTLDASRVLVISFVLHRLTSRRFLHSRRGFTPTARWDPTGSADVILCDPLGVPTTEEPRGPSQSQPPPTHNPWGWLRGQGRIPAMEVEHGTAQVGRALDDDSRVNAGAGGSGMVTGEALRWSNGSREAALEWDEFFMEDLGGVLPGLDPDEDEDENEDKDEEEAREVNETIRSRSTEGVRGRDQTDGEPVGTPPWSDLMRAPSRVMMMNDDGSLAPVPPDLHDTAESWRDPLDKTNPPPPSRVLTQPGGGLRGAASGAASVPNMPAPSRSGRTNRRGTRGGRGHQRTFSGASFASSGGSGDLANCGDLLDMGEAFGALGGLGVVDNRDGIGGERGSGGGGGPSGVSTRGFFGDSPSRSPGDSGQSGSSTLTPAVAAAAAAKAAALAGAANRPSEAAKKTAIRLKSGGWWELERALLRVLSLLVREMKPLGMEGMATFDPIAGIVLWREQRRAAAARRRATAELYPHAPKPPTPDLTPLLVGVRHAAAAYGSLASLLQNNSMQDKAHGFVGAVQAALVSGDGDAVEKKATIAAARSAGIRPEDIVSADWCTLAFSPASYVAVDHGAETVVVAIRGTVSGGDLLTDACSTSVPFLGGWAHAGMVASAWQVIRTQMAPASRALSQHPGYSLLVTGHSMGAGVAACLAMLIRSGDGDVLAAAEEGLTRAREKDGVTEEAAAAALGAIAQTRCYCFAAPSVCSLDLSLAAREHTTSVVAGKDVIPRLCYASVRRLLRRLNSAAPSQPVMRAISNALGGRDKQVFGGSGGALSRLGNGHAFRGGAGEGSGGEGSGRDTPGNDDDDAHGTEGVKGSTAGPAGIPPEQARIPPLHGFSPPRLTPEQPPAPSNPPLPNDTSRSLGGSGAATAAMAAASSATAASAPEARCQGNWDDLEGTQGLELRDHGASDFLVQPGTVIHLRHLSSADGPTAEERHPTAFTEIPLSIRMMMDHVPMVYMSAIDRVIEKSAREAEEAKAEASRMAEEVRVYGPGGYTVYAAAAARLERRRRRREGGRISHLQRRQRRDRDISTVPAERPRHSCSLQSHPLEGLEEDNNDEDREDIDVNEGDFRDEKSEEDGDGRWDGPYDGHGDDDTDDDDEDDDVHVGPGRRVWNKVRRAVLSGVQPFTRGFRSRDHLDSAVHENLEYAMSVPPESDDEHESSGREKQMWGSRAKAARAGGGDFDDETRCSASSTEDRNNDNDEVAEPRWITGMVEMLGLEDGTDDDVPPEETADWAATSDGAIGDSAKPGPPSGSSRPSPLRRSASAVGRQLLGRPMQGEEDEESVEESEEESDVSDGEGFQGPRSTVGRARSAPGRTTALGARPQPAMKQPEEESTRTQSWGTIGAGLGLDRLGSLIGRLKQDTNKLFLGGNDVSMGGEIHGGVARTGDGEGFSGGGSGIPAFDHVLSPTIAPSRGSHGKGIRLPGHLLLRGGSGRGRSSFHGGGGGGEGGSGGGVGAINEAVSQTYVQDEYIRQARLEKK